MVDGVMSVLQGGKFGHGAGISARMGASDGIKRSMKAAGPIKRLITQVTIGSTVSRIGGGKFANGAGSAAFSMMLSRAYGAMADGGSSYAERNSGSVEAFDAQEKRQAPEFDLTTNEGKIAAVDWVRANGKQFGIDTSKINETYLGESNDPDMAAWIDGYNNIMFTDISFDGKPIYISLEIEYRGITIEEGQDEYFGSALEKLVFVFGHEANHTLGYETFYGIHPQSNRAGLMARDRFKELYE